MFLEKYCIDNMKKIPCEYLPSIVFGFSISGFDSPTSDLPDIIVQRINSDIKILRQPEEMRKLLKALSLPSLSSRLSSESLLLLSRLTVEFEGGME